MYKHVFTGTHVTVVEPVNKTNHEGPSALTRLAHK
jgi:hypothetical protein